MSVETNYAARPLAAPREYAGYQFFARLSMEGHTPEECFRYTALTVQNWLCERIQNAGNAVPQAFVCPPAEVFAETPSAALRSADSPVAGIESLPEEGIWSLWVREPDPGRNGRSFVTHAGVRLLREDGGKDNPAPRRNFPQEGGEGTVEFGVRIDIIDSDASPAEAEAYRPKFIRLLFKTPSMTVKQTAVLPYKHYISVGNRKELSQLTELLTDRDNLMPCVIFTYREKLRQPVSPENIRREMTAGDSGFSPIPLTVRASELKLPKYEGPVKGHDCPRKLFPVLSDSPETVPPHLRERGLSPKAGEDRKREWFLPYSAGEFAKHSYGFCHVFVLTEDLYTELKGRFGFGEINGGDILVKEPAAFGGNGIAYPYKPGLRGRAYDSIAESVAVQMRRYSLHKPYRFGKIMFAKGVAEYKRDREIENAIRQYRSDRTDTERELLKRWEEEHERNRELEQERTRMQQSLVEAFHKGVSDERARNAELERELAELKAEKADWEEERDNQRGSFADAKGQKESLANLRSIGEMPKTAADVVKYFRLVFADRIDFTEQGKRTAAKCDIKPEELWQCLYAMATALCDIHRDNLPDVEKAFKNRTGWSVAMSEGGQTRGNPRLMALRKDTYQGRTVSIEPHVKFDRDKRRVGAAYQRLYYCYDGETRRIVVGFVGDHLENHSSLSFS